MDDDTRRSRHSAASWIAASVNEYAKTPGDGIETCRNAAASLAQESRMSPQSGLNFSCSEHGVTVADAMPPKNPSPTRPLSHGPEGTQLLTMRVAPLLENLEDES